MLLRNGMLVDPVAGSRRRADLRISGGVIAEIDEDIEPCGAAVYEASGQLISPGWIDMHVHLREPGFEYKETIASGCSAAAAGGFTAVACMPNTNPPIHTRDVVEFVLRRAEGLAVDVYPIACVSKDRAGKELAEMSQLAEGGAVAFSDDGAPVQGSSLMRRALEYASMLGMPVINHMEDLGAGPQGHMNEGLVSTRLGVRPVPALSEELMVARDLLLAELTGGHLHVAHISTAKSVEMVRDAKARGIPVTAEVCPHHFALTDEAVMDTGFSTATKMHPPLRTDSDVRGILEGLADDTIDVICTDHAPHASFEKDVEFSAAPNGIIGLESAWGLVGRYLTGPGILSVEQAVYKMCVAPRRILNLELPDLRVGEPANLTVFDASTEWEFDQPSVLSKSCNTPFLGTVMQGRPWAIYNNGQLRENPLRGA